MNTQNIYHVSGLGRDNSLSLVSEGVNHNDISEKIKSIPELKGYYRGYTQLQEKKLLSIMMAYIVLGSSVLNQMILKLLKS